MTGNRRKNLIRWAERIAAGLLLLDALLYFGVLRPIRNAAQGAFESSRDARLAVIREEARVKRLEWYKDSVPATEKSVDDFLTHQIQPKRKSFMRAAKLMRGLADKSGIEFDGMSYKPEAVINEPLDRMSITLRAKGSFESLMKFAHSLESTRDEFFVIRDFSFESAQNAGLSLKLSTDLYLTP